MPAVAAVLMGRLYKWRYNVIKWGSPEASYEAARPASR